MILENDSSVLDSHEMYFSGLQEQIGEIKTLHQEKQWHQLTECLLDYVKQPDLQNQDTLLELYSHFIQGFEGRLNQKKAVQLAIQVACVFSQPSQGACFLREMKGRVVTEQSASILLDLKVAELELHSAKPGEYACQDVLVECEAKCQSIKDLDSVVFSQLYRLGYLYYQLQNDLELFYKYALQYIAYTPESAMHPQEKQYLPFKMAVSVIISNKIYNFSELLEQPVLKSLSASPQGWAYELLAIFNRGSVAEFHSFFQHKNHLVTEYNDLHKNMAVMEQKIRLMGFLQKAFSLDKNNRCLSFEQVAEVAVLSGDDAVERLVMKAMSLGLVKGKIDQRARRVTISWIVPQVLDHQRVEVMRNKVARWSEGLEALCRQVEGEMQEGE